MKKMKLDIDAVRVVSFPTGRAPAAAGTAAARGADATPVCSGTTCILQCLTAQPRCF
jgi:xanthine dehydrogenase molybdopterin-binding subunit B